MSQWETIDKKIHAFRRLLMGYYMCYQHEGHGDIVRRTRDGA